MKKLLSKKQIRKIKILFLLSLILTGVFLSYQKLEHSKLKISNKEFIELITNHTFRQEDSLFEDLVDKALEITNPIKLMNREYQKYLYESEKKETIEEIFTPRIYLYNTHQTEEYASSTYAEFSVNPTVIMNNYILEDIFNKNGEQTLVEESSITEILSNHNWNYAQSYRASRILLEEKKEKYPTLEYFIDIHRDSLEKAKTTVTIDNKDYAKVLFIVGMENETYEKNLELTERIDSKLKEYYPNLSKGIYKKSGAGVNGIYNQDFSPNTILIEIGGYENTTTEVLNTSLAFAKCFLEVIHE